MSRSTIRVVLKSGYVHEMGFASHQVANIMSEFMEGLHSDEIRTFAVRAGDGSGSTLLAIMNSEIAMVSVADQEPTR